jgi:ribosomal protein L14
MIYIKTKLDVADNSGARKVSFIGVIGKKKTAVVESRCITASVKERFQIRDKKEKLRHSFTDASSVKVRRIL